MTTHMSIITIISLLIAVLGPSAGWAQQAAAANGGRSISGRGTVAVNPAVSADDDDDAGDRWDVQFNGDAGGGMKGKVRIGGIRVSRAGNVGNIQWKLSDGQLSGTVSDEAGEGVLASFKGTVSAKRIAGTFTTADGQTGSWTWEGPLPQVRPGGE